MCTVIQVLEISKNIMNTITLWRIVSLDSVHKSIGTFVYEACIDNCFGIIQIEDDWRLGKAKAFWVNTTYKHSCVSEIFSEWNGKAVVHTSVPDNKNSMTSWEVLSDCVPVSSGAYIRMNKNWHCFQFPLDLQIKWGYWTLTFISLVTMCLLLIHTELNWV